MRISFQQHILTKIPCILRDYRKSPKMAILAISHLMISITYRCQNHRFRVFRQSLRVSHYCNFTDTKWISQEFLELIYTDLLEKHRILKMHFCCRYEKASVDSWLSVKPQYMAEAIGRILVIKIHPILPHIFLLIYQHGIL